MKKLISYFTQPPVDGPSSILVIRLMTGLVFFWEGALKFVYANQGVGRFTKLGFPLPAETAHLVAIIEIIGGMLIMCGFLTRIASFVFIVEMIVAILSTKIGVYLGTSPLPLPPAPPQTGFWAVLHEIRADYAQLMTSIFLLVTGPGRISFDRRRKEKRKG